MVNSMGWRDYLQERINSAPVLANNNTDDSRYRERTILFRVMKFVASFAEGKTDNRIIVMYGLRGIGKSTVLFQVYNRLRTGHFFREVDELKKIPQENILYLSIDQASIQALPSESKSPLYEAVKRFCEEIHSQPMETLEKKLFVLVDEAQFDKNWAVAAKSIYDSSKNIFLIITGSSALALNLDTDTARRAIKEPLFPLNFMEYNTIKNRVFPLLNTSERLRRLVLQNDKTVISDLNKSIKAITEEMQKKNIILESEVYEYLTTGSFPYGFSSSRDVTYRKIVDMINRIITQDLISIANYETNTIPDIIKIVGALALKPAGEISQDKLSQNYGIPIAKVKSILDSLEKTHLIYSVKPYPEIKGRGGLSKAFKYYFMSTTLLSAIRYLNGKTTITPEERGLLWENAIGSSLFKLCFTTPTVYNLFYDPRQDGNVDFLLQNPLSGQIIPIEVGLNKKSGQLISAIKQYGPGYGLLVSEAQEITIQDNILKIPFWFFLYL